MAPEQETTSPDRDMEPTTLDSSCTSHKPLGFQPVNDLQDNSLAKRNSWIQASQPPGHSYTISSKPKSRSQSSQPPTHSYHNSPKRNLSSRSSQPPTHAYPSTPSNPPTKINIPPTNLPPTPDTTPVSSQSLKRTHSTALEVRYPAQDSAAADAPSPSERASKRQHTHTPSGEYDGALDVASPSHRPSKRHTTHFSHPAKATHPLPTPTHSPHRSPFRTDLTPKFSIAYKAPTSNEATISWQELKLVTESLLSQVDWKVVAMDVGSNRSAGTYKRAVKEVLQERIYEMGEQEEGEER